MMNRREAVMSAVQLLMTPSLAMQVGPRVDQLATGALYVEQSGSAVEGPVVFGLLVVERPAECAAMLAAARKTTKYHRIFNYKKCDKYKVRFVSALLPRMENERGWRFQLLEFRAEPSRLSLAERARDAVTRFAKEHEVARVMIRVQGADELAAELKGSVAKATAIREGAPAYDRTLLSLCDWITGSFRRGLPEAVETKHNAIDQACYSLGQTVKRMPTRFSKVNV